MKTEIMDRGLFSWSFRWALELESCENKCFVGARAESCEKNLRAWHKRYLFVLL